MMPSPTQLRREQTARQTTLQKKTERVQRYNNSDNMKLSMVQPSSQAVKPSSHTLQDPKEIVNARFDAGKFRQFYVTHDQCHRKGNIALRDGKPFYLK